MAKKKIILKLTGEIFLDPKTHMPSCVMIQNVIDQLKQLRHAYQFGIVIGGGNFFRGSQHGTAYGTRRVMGDYIGMMATIMNGLILKDLLAQHNVVTTLFSSIMVPQLCTPLSPDNITYALQHSDILIFSGGTGNPLFTTDTNAVLCSLQINADEIWKATKVDGIYTQDPYNDNTAHLLKEVSYQEALEKNLGVMDPTAYMLAQQHKQKIRIFNIFEPNSLIHAAHDSQFGSLIQ